MHRRSLGSILAVLVPLVLATTLLRPSLTQAHDRPFHANIVGNAHLSPTSDPNVVINQETGGGKATHLGKFSWSTLEYADFSVVPGGVGVTGQFTMTAANGDELYGVHSTIGLFNIDGDLVLSGQFLLVGGTGRFADATGHGDLYALASLGVGLPFEGTLDGVIDY